MLTHSIKDGKKNFKWKEPLSLQMKGKSIFLENSHTKRVFYYLFEVYVFFYNWWYWAWTIRILRVFDYWLLPVVTFINDLTYVIAQMGEKYHPQTKLNGVIP